MTMTGKAVTHDYVLKAIAEREESVRQLEERQKVNDLMLKSARDQLRVIREFYAILTEKEAT